MADEVTRKSHVKRFFEKNRTTGEPNAEVWLDVERIDSLKTKQGTGQYFQRTDRKFHWLDKKSENGNETREVTWLKVRNPNDEEQYIEVDVIDELTTKQMTGRDFKRSKVALRNDADDETTRKVSLRRVTHFDTTKNIDDVVSKEQYKKVPGTEDEEQYVDVEIIDEFLTKQMTGQEFERTTVALRNDPLKDEFKKPPPRATNRPVRLDPFQNIINVQWSEVEFVFISVSATIELHINGAFRPGDIAYTEELQIFCNIGNSTPVESIGRPIFVTSLRHLKINGQLDSSYNVWKNGKMVTGGFHPDVSGLNVPFPAEISLTEFLFLDHFDAPSFGRRAFGIRWNIGGAGAPILDRRGNVVGAAEPYLMADSATLQGRGVRLEAIMCYSHDVPFVTQSFFPGMEAETFSIEDIQNGEFPSSIPEISIPLDISGVVVEHEGQFFQAIGIQGFEGTDSFANSVNIICKRIPSS